MSYKPHIKWGTWNAICDRCGRVFKSDKLRREWTGHYVCVEGCWEERNIQDFDRGEAEKTSPPWTRVEQAASYTNVVTLGDVNPMTQVPVSGATNVSTNFQPTHEMSSSSNSNVSGDPAFDAYNFTSYTNSTIVVTGPYGVIYYDGSENMKEI